MPDAFTSALKDLEQVSTEIGQLVERLDTLTRRREHLRKLLRNLRSATSAAVVTGDEELPDAVRQVLDAIAQLGGSARLSDIANQTGLENRVVATRLQRAIKLRRLEREGHGKYRLPNADSQSATAVGATASSAQDAESGESESR